MLCFFSPRPPTLLHSKDQFFSAYWFFFCAPSSAQTLLVAAADLKREMETLQYREHKRLAIQGQITAVRYVTRPKTTELQTREVMEMTESISSEMVKYSFSLIQLPGVGHQGADAHNPPLTAEQTTGASLTPRSLKRNPAKRRILQRLVLENSKECEMY